jgi:hypothetical protein
MAIKQTILRGKFIDTMKETASWSYESGEILFNYLNDLEGDIEFDPIALRCEYSEVATADLEPCHNPIGSHDGVHLCWT